MKLARTKKHQDIVLLSKESMLPFFSENDIPWDYEERLKLYSRLEIYEVIEDGLIGYMALRENEGCFFLADLQILEKFRHLGFGTRLLKEAKSIAKARGYECIFLKVFKTSPALALYLRNGFKHLKEEQHVYVLSSKV